MEILVEQPTTTPVRKVRIGAAGGASGAPITIVLLWVLGSTGVEVTPEVAGAIGAIISTAAYFVTAYFTRAAKTDVGG